VAGCKHFVPYDGRALTTASDYDLFATYLPGFKRCMEAEGRAWKGAMNVMCSYTEQSYAGSNSCTNPRILDDILKRRFNFTGFVISDLGAVDGHTAASIAAGMDVYLGSGPSGNEVHSWLSSGKLTHERLDDAVSRTLLPRFMEGEFDPPHMVPYWDQAHFGCDKVGAPEHHQLAYEAAVQSLVLLSNNDGVLPLAKSKGKVAIIGPFGTHARWMYNRYSHVPAQGSPFLVSLAQAMASALGSDRVTSAAGCSDVATTTACLELDSAAVVAAQKDADVLVYALGTGEPIESETSNGAHGPAGATLLLPGKQEALVEAGLKTGKKVVVVLFTASPKNGAWMSKAHAVVHAAYPQMFGAQAVTDVLLGNAVFSGKLATTWPKQWNCTPSTPSPKHHPRWAPAQCEVLPGRFILDGHRYSNVTYRYGASNVLFPFGFGLSYASFKYSALTHAVSVGPCVALEISVTVTNLAKTAAPEIVQAYLQWEKGTVAPQLQLVAFEKILVAAQGEVTVKLTLLPRHFAVLVGASTTTSSFLDCPSGIPTKEGCNTTSTHPTPPRWEVQPMTMKLWVGGQQPALRGNEGARAPSNVLKSTFQVTGDRTPLVTCPGGTPS
jgi:beta-glucosidase